LAMTEDTVVFNSWERTVVPIVPEVGCLILIVGGGVSGDACFLI